MIHERLERIEGIITRYMGNGRKLGYPTANVAAETSLQDGVYFGYAQLGDFIDHPAVIFIGTPETEGVADATRRIEAHLVGIPDVDYYDQRLVLEICHFHRKNERFASIEELVRAIDADDVAAHEWFVQGGA